LKDIENYKLARVQESLQRLDQALSRLESAAVIVNDKVTTSAGAAASTAAFEEKFNRLNREHATLRETAGQVAAKLDAAIGRLSSALQD
jgi:biopolymer transport protein ExbB/TolQ